MSELLDRVASDEQQAVIDAPDGSFTVVASAGAGKTFVLVERYLRHVLEEGLWPDQILTITFTKKAAAEMKTRIVNRLRSKGLFDQAQVAETGPIQTIHSFCERILRENALEAGLDPKFEIMTEVQATRLTLECIRDVLASRLEEAPDAEALIRYVAGKPAGFGGTGSPYSGLEDAIQQVLRELRSSRFSADEIAEIYRNTESLSRFWEEQIRAALPAKAVEPFDAEPVRDLHARVQAACKGAGVPVPAWAKGKEDPKGEEESRRHTSGLVQLACEAWWRLDRAMGERQMLDFSALEIRADRLLKRSEVTRIRLQGQYQVVMVDESQDVNPIQHALIEHIAVPRTMMVGDAQQSIYGFRQADVRLFRERCEAPSTKRLAKNWRSEPGILNFVDVVFGRLWGEDYQPMNADAGPMDLDNDSAPSFEGVEIWRQPAKSPKTTAGFIAELVREGVRPSEIAVLVRDGFGALATQKALGEAEVPSRITGGSERFYTRLEVRDLANTMRALTDPYDDFALLGTLRSPMAGLSLDSIVLLGVQTPVVQHLEAFQAPAPEDQTRLAGFLEWYTPLSRYADRLSAWEVLSEVFARSGYLPALARRPKSDQMLANVRKLLMLAAQEPELGPREFAENIHEIQNLRHQEGDAPADDDDAELVKIMTIHKAKGLEWPVVVVPQNDKSIGARAREVMVDPRSGLVATKFGAGVSMAHKLLKDVKKRREDEEEKRILYVALTRAKKRLCICMMPPGRGLSVSKLLADLIDVDRMPGIRIRQAPVDPA